MEEDTNYLSQTLQTIQNNGWNILKMHYSGTIGFWYVLTEGKETKARIVYELTSKGKFNNTFYTWHYH